MRKIEKLSIDRSRKAQIGVRIAAWRTLQGQHLMCPLCQYDRLHPLGETGDWPHWSDHDTRVLRLIKFAVVRENQDTRDAASRKQVRHAILVWLPS